MGQLGFFDADKRLAALSAKGDPLEAIDRLVSWESFRADIEAVVLMPDASNGFRPALLFLTWGNTSRDVFADSDCAVPDAGFATRLKRRRSRHGASRAASTSAQHAVIRYRRPKRRRIGEKEPGSCSRRARVRCSADLTGRPDRADDRNRQSASKEPRLQHPSPRDTRRRMKVVSV
jgi:hypothetical protein